MRKLSVTAVFFVVAALSACHAPEPKDKGIQELSAVVTRWDDGLKLASSTGRIALSAPVAQLQAARRDLDAVVVGECLKPAKEELKQHMDSMIDAFLAFMASDESAYTIRAAEAFRRRSFYDQARLNCYVGH